MSGMGWRCGAGGMLAALIFGAIGWPGTAAAQFTLPQTAPASRQLAPSSGTMLPSAGPTLVPAPAAVPPTMVPPSGTLRPPPMPGPASAAAQVSLSLVARFGRDGQTIT